MTQQIQEYSKVEAALSMLRKEYGATVFDVSTRDGMTAARKGRAEVRKYRTALEAKRKEIKAPALERCRVIDAEAKRITGELLKIERPLDEAIKKEEARKAEERARREREEAERVARQRAAIEAIRAPIVRMSAASSSEIAQQIEITRKADCCIGDMETEAVAVRDAVLSQLEELHAAAVVREKEQERIARERAELEAQRLAEQQRAQAEWKRLEAERREAEQQRAEKERVFREEMERKQAEALKQQRAEEAKLRAERERLEREYVAEKEAKAKAQAEPGAIRDGWEILESFVDRFRNVPEFGAIVKIISDHLESKNAV